MNILTANQGSFTGNDVDIRSGTISGGTITLGSASPGTQDFLTRIDIPVNNLTVNTSSNSVTLQSSITVNGTLTLTSGDLNTGSFTLTMPGTATSTGATDAVGNVKRTGFVIGTPLSFGNPFNTITFDAAATVPTDVTVNLIKSSPGGFSNSVKRVYGITANGGSGFSATLRLHYLDSELNGNTESALQMWRYNGTNWVQQTKADFNTSNNWVETNGVAAFSSWTLAQGSPSAVCTYQLSPASDSFPAGGGTGTLLVQSLSVCRWAAVSNADWITVTDGSSGAGVGAVSYSVAPNPETRLRTGTMTIVDQTFTITQATDCPIFLSATSQSFAANGGVGSVNVTGNGNCAWSATTADNFISILSSGNGTVTYSVATNTGLGRRSGTITIAGQSFTVLQGAAFRDVPLSHPYYTEIGKLSARGVTVGCGDGNFCPELSVTREQMAIFIIRALGEFDPPAPATQRFADVPPTKGGYAFIDDFAARGITAGCGGGNFCPDVEVTRGPMAAFIMRALGVFNPETPATQRFFDVPPSHSFYGFIEEMAVRGITKGCGGGNYCPEAAVSRGQMAVFLVRAFRL